MGAFKKLREARKILGMNQADFANAIGVSQNEVSKMEAGGKKFIPNSYILFLQQKGYDINTLFNDQVPLGKIENGEVLRKSKQALILKANESDYIVMLIKMIILQGEKIQELEKKVKQ